MSYIFQIIDTEELSVLAVRREVRLEELPAIAGGIFQEVAGYIAAKGEEPVGPAIIGYFSVSPDRLEVEIGFPSKGDLPGKGEIIRTAVPAGKKAQAFHKGSYAGLGPVYEVLLAFLREKGHEPAGISYEYYYNSPEDVPESELLTKVEFLLK